MNYFSTTEANSLNARETPRQLQFRSKRLALAQRMYLAALNSLVAYQKHIPVPVDAKVAVDRTLTRMSQEERSLPRNPLQPEVRAELRIEVDSEPNEGAREERELVRARVGG